MMTPPCWICGSPGLEVVRASRISGELSSKEFAITDSAYGVTGELSRCPACGFMQCSELTDVLGYYETLQDGAYEAGSAERSRQARDVLRIALRFKPSGRLLDIGAGSGVLVEEASRMGYDAQGVEPSAWLCERGREKGLCIHRGVFPHPDVTGLYDVVTLVDVLEHVPDPVGLLRDMAQVLNPQGIAVVVTPDLGSVCAHVMGWKWWHFRIAHIGYFDHRTLNRAAEKAGLEAISVGRPIWYFKAGYLIERFQAYWPLFLRFPLPDFINRRVIRLNLGDSLQVVYRRCSDTSS